MAAPGSLIYNSEFSADTAAAKQNLKDYQTQIQAVGATIKQQTREAQDNYRLQILAAKAAGAGSEQLDRITQEYNTTILATKNAQRRLTDEILLGNYSAMESEQAINAVREQAVKTITAQTVAIKEFAAANANAHGAEIGGAIAGGAAIRTIDGGQNVRAVENFLAKTLGFGNLFQTIFPVVGAIATLQILGEMGAKVFEIGEKASHAGEEITAAFDGLHSKSVVTIDDLTVQADKLQDNIDKLSGHPSNGLKTALDEAKSSADKLLTSLRADRKELADLLKEHSVGTFGSLLSHVAGTGIQKEQILGDNQALQGKIEEANSQFDVASANAKSLDEIKSLGKTRDKAIHDAIQSTIDTYKKEGARLKQEQESSNNAASIIEASGGSAQRIDNSAKIANILGSTRFYQDRLNTFDAQTRVSDLTEQDNALKGQKEQKTIDAATAAKGRAALQKEIEEWKKLQTQVKETQNEGERLKTQYNKTTEGMLNDFDSSNQKDQSQQLAVAARMTAAFVKSLQELSSAQVQAKNSAAELAITQDLADGKITAYDAALQRQTLHTNEYNTALQNLKSSLDAVQGDSMESNTRRNDIQKQIVELNSRRSGEQIQDNAAVAQNTVTGALKNANTKWLQDTKNMAPQIANVYTQTLSGFNDQLSNLLTGQKTSWSSFFQSIASSLAHIGLNSLEGGIMNAISGSGGSNASSSSSSGGSGLFGGLVRGIFGGARATGGPVDAGKTYLIGEKGPELATFGSNASITPNSKIGGLLSATHNWTVNVDSRGATNPAEVEQAAHRAVMNAAPHIIAASLQAHKNQSARIPTSKRN